MRPAIIWTVLRREWYETVRNRLLMSTILLPPILLTVAPIVLAAAVGEEALPPELAQQVLQQRPEWSSFTSGELAGAFAVQQFLVFFLLMPAYIPLSIATFSIIGEKQARSLEPVLAAPIRTSELLAAKAIAALVPGVLAGWATYAIFVILASIYFVLCITLTQVARYLEKRVARRRAGVTGAAVAPVVVPDIAAIAE